jgi:hypothetical protein
MSRTASWIGIIIRVLICSVLSLASEYINSSRALAQPQSPSCSKLVDDPGNSFVCIANLDGTNAQQTIVGSFGAISGTGGYILILEHTGVVRRLICINQPCSSISIPGALVVNPTANIAASGPQAGTFSPSSFQYQLSATTGSVGYSISGVPSWLTASATSGTVTTSATTVTFTVNATANALVPGSYGPATITFTNTTNNLGTQTRTATLTVNVNPLPVLQVSPGTNIAASGYQSGPFSPSSLQYQLSASSGSVGYTITGVPSWLTASATSGTATTSPTTVTFSVNSSANALAVGTYGPVTITFTNTTNGLGTQSLTATLTVNATGWGGIPSRRTFVSANGNDGNNCSRPAPCRTFQTAHDRTAAKGEINILDPSGYGQLTITKAISIVNDGVGSAGVLVLPGGTGITINAGATDIVNLRGLVIEGTGFGADGIVINSGMSVNIQNCVIRNLTEFGIYLMPYASSNLVISKTLIADNKNVGVFIRPYGSGTVTATLNNVAVNNNILGGIYIYGSSSTGFVKATIEDSSIAGNIGQGVYVLGGAPTSVMVRHSDLINNLGNGVLVSGPTVTLRLAKSTITGNGTGWSAINSATLLSYGDNNIDGNTNDGGTPPPIPDK